MMAGYASADSLTDTPGERPHLGHINIKTITGPIGPSAGAATTSISGVAATVAGPSISFLNQQVVIKGLTTHTSNIIINNSTPTGQNNNSNGAISIGDAAIELYSSHASAGGDFVIYSANPSYDEGPLDTLDFWDNKTDNTPLALYGGTSIYNGMWMAVPGAAVIAFGSDQACADCGSNVLGFSKDGTGTSKVLDVGNGTYHDISASVKAAIFIAGTDVTSPAMVSTGTKFTASGCSNSTTVGGASAGQFVSGTTGTCTVTITMNGATGLTAPNGWSCYAADITTSADTLTQTASTTTTCTISGTTVSSDTIIFHAMAY